jgi:hypothetical protein
MADKLTWSTAELAAKLGILPKQFSNARRRLRAAGFPEALPGLKGRYDPLAIEGWLARLRGATGTAPGGVPAASPEEIDYAAILDRRAEALGSMPARGRLCTLRRLAASPRP